MPYTSHGHPYGVMDASEPQPRAVAKCGDPFDLCAECAREADWMDPIDKVRNVRDAQGRDGTWNTSGYMLGLYNGLELALSILEGERDPVFRSGPSEDSDRGDRPTPDMSGPEYQPVKG